MKVETARLTLTPLSALAAGALLCDPETVAELVGATIPRGWPQPDLLDVLPRQTAGREHHGVWLMIDRDTTTVVGDAGFHGPPVEGRIEIGYAVAPDFRRRGYATEAAGALTEWALAQEEVVEVVARCEAGNAASIATLERNGFERTSEDRETIHWSRR